MASLYDEIMAEKRKLSENKKDIEEIMERLENQIDIKIEQRIIDFSVSDMTCMCVTNDDKKYNNLKACELLVEQLYHRGIKNAYVDYCIQSNNPCENNWDGNPCTCIGITIFEIPELSPENEEYIEIITNEIMNTLMRDIKYNIKNSRDVDTNYKFYIINKDLSENCHRGWVDELRGVHYNEQSKIFKIARINCIDDLISHGFRAIVIRDSNCRVYIQMSNIQKVWEDMCLQNT